MFSKELATEPVEDLLALIDAEAAAAAAAASTDNGNPCMAVDRIPVRWQDMCLACDEHSSSITRSQILC